MNKAIELVLTNLIPRHSGAIPPALLDLSSSLLAQSRVKCSLNAEQEIARTYACAHIACERLKTTLNLPKIEPRPPVPPSVYKKLYAYLESTLQSGTPRKRTRHTDDIPRSGSHLSTPSRAQKRTPGRNDTPIKSALPTPQRGTPSKGRSLAGFRTPKKGLKFEKRDDSRIPRWITVVGREMCRELETDDAMAHMLAGVESLVWLDMERGKGAMMGKWPALMIAVWAHVRKRLREVGADGEGVMMTKEEFAEWRGEALGFLRGVRTDEGVRGRVEKGAGGEEMGWKGWDLPSEEEEEDDEGRNERDVNNWMKEINTQGWLDMDWYYNITSTSAHANTNANSRSASEEAEEGTERALVREDEMRYGLGTMRQKKVDYLTEERRAAYKVWERRMRAEIERRMGEVEQEGQKRKGVDRGAVAVAA
ncbi:Origin recognition complex subunit 6 protein [Rutstroemia sp. NJR-2017a BVV2]|nr:Origin recognition complex subunit 6 protein [Rutstroemia sp. NJR-2017a BVV2]